MAGSSSGRSLEQTPTWAVAVVCFLLLVISIFIEHIIHLIGNWFKKKHKRALYESLEKIKSELMLLGFISLLLTIGQGLISQICIPASVGATWHPCSQAEEEEDVEDESEDSNRRRLLSVSNFRRVLAVTSSSNTTDTCAAQGKVPFISADGIHQLHIFIFILAVFHVLYCVMTMALGRAKMGKWKKWEKETRTAEYQFSHDPERFRFTRETSFGRRHLNAWSKISVLVWIVCFFRQFLRSVPKVDYLTLRHGFIMAHLAPHSQTQFDFQKYINRSLEEDFKVVVGISPPIWFLAVLFLLFNTHGWYSYLWLPFIPLVVILLVGTKLQVIVTQMGLRIQDRGEVVRGVPAVEPGDDLFWFNRPRLILYLINYVLFQNAFQLAFLAWSWFQFGFASCFHRNIEDVVIRISMGVLIQILCSYVTLPLYALVIQMGSTMKPTIFNARVAAALKRWHRGAQKHIKESKNNSNFTTPLSSSPATPTHSFSPVHLLRHPHRSDNNNYCLQTSPRRSDFDNVNNSDTEAESPSPSYFHQHGRRPRGDGSSSSNYHHRSVEHEEDQVDRPSIGQIAPVTELEGEQHEIDIESKEFSFDKRTASI